MKSNIKNVAVVGTGVIGTGWIIRFLAHDKKVIALSHVLIERKKLDLDLNNLLPIIKNNNVNAVVVGLPLNKEGTKGRQAQSLITFATHLKNRFNLPILMWDERFSTSAVERAMVDSGVKKKNIKKSVIYNLY